MARPLTRQQQLENAAFLRALRCSGNARDAARAVGAHRAKFTRRRAAHPAFATAWDAALAFADAALCGRQHDGKAGLPPDEPRIHRTKSGRLQLRRHQPGRLDRGAEQRFLAALSVSANVRLSAAAAGFNHAAFYARKRNNPAFAREWRLALAEGYERLELALLASSAPESFEDDRWRRNDRPEMPPMTCSQALQLMYLHQKEARLLDTPIPVDRLRPGETWEARSEMLGLIAEARRAQEREAFRIAEAERLATKGYTWIDWEAEGNPLPDLAQVTGWSRATGKPGVDEERALFGGWRVGDMKRRDKD